MEALTGCPSRFSPRGRYSSRPLVEKSNLSKGISVENGNISTQLWESLPSPQQGKPLSAVLNLDVLHGIRLSFCYVLGPKKKPRYLQYVVASGRGHTSSPGGSQWRKKEARK